MHFLLTNHMNKDGTECECKLQLIILVPELNSVDALPLSACGARKARCIHNTSEEFMHVVNTRSAADAKNNRRIIVCPYVSDQHETCHLF